MHDLDLLLAHQRRRMPAPGKLDQLGLRAASGHLLGGLAGQQVRMLATQHQDRAGYCIPDRPEIDIVHRLLEHVANGRIVMQRVGAVLLADRRVQGELRPPQFIRDPEIGIDGLKIRGRFLQIAETQVLADVLTNTLQRTLRNERSYVVQHQSSDRALGLGRHQHADQPAHRRADQIHRFEASVVQEGGHVLQIGRIGVCRLVREPTGATPPRHIDLDHAEIPGHTGRQAVEIAAIPRQTMHTHHNPFTRAGAEIGKGKPDRSVVIGVGKAAGIRTHGHLWRRSRGPAVSGGWSASSTGALRDTAHHRIRNRATVATVPLPGSSNQGVSSDG